MEKKIQRGNKEESAILSKWIPVVYSLITTLLVAGFYAAFSKGVSIKIEIFIGFAVLSGILSLAQLDKKERSLRAVLNIRKSWLSRKIVAYCLFVPLASLWLFFPQQNELGLLATIFGLLTLVSIDNIYRQLPVKKENKYHSADVLFFTAFFYVAILVSNPWMFFGALILKAYLYITRKMMFKKEGENIRLVFSGLRLLLGFVIPVILFFVSGLDPFKYFILISVVLGEVIDRMEFYMEL